MSGVVTAIAAVGIGTALYSGSQSAKANKSARGRLDALQYEEDPDYRESQDALKKLGLGLMEGDVPDYYKSIGETGGSEFENMLSLMNRDIEKSAAESAASSGRARGGNLAAVTAGAVADNSAKLRYADFERALTGKKALLGTGIEVTQGVRSAGQTETARTNEFNAMKTQANIDLDYQKAADKSQMVSSIGGSITGAISGLSSGGQGGSFLDKLFAGKASTTTGGTTSSMSGVSSLGSISDDELSDLFANYARGK